MSEYLVKRKGWRYDFTLKGTRYTGAWFKTKTKAKQAEAQRKEEILNPKAETKRIQTDMAFLDLVNRRLDQVKTYNSSCHYRDHRYLCQRWVKRWENLMCGEITREMVEAYILERSKVSAYTANQELRYLRATFNFGIKRELIAENPTSGIDFLPVEKVIRYVPPPEDIEKVIQAADPDTRDYLLTIRETMARVGEINRLTWDDVNLEEKYVVLYTRKKKGGSLTPRKIPMTQRLLQILSQRQTRRDETKPWVFWHTYWSSKTGRLEDGPFQDRKGIMFSLCQKAGVRYFRFHAMRHAGASLMDSNNVSIGAIQRLLGHENRTTTEIYLHSIGMAEREAMAVYEKATQNSHMKSHTEMKRELTNVG